MHDKRGDDKDNSNPTEELILRTVAAHADSLLRTARRHSICFDDAQDAYQRALEILMANADRLDVDRVPGWLHVVVKREAQAIQRSRKRLVSATEVDFDAHESGRVPAPDEQLLSFDLLSRSAEALQRLKPHELRALWLKAQGHSYNEIGAITGWSYTKVNRCLTEGRKTFLDRYAGIESGAECKRWLPVLSAIIDGEAAPEDVIELRPHLRNCPGCRATLKALHDSSAPLAAILPIPLVAATTGAADHISSLFMRAYEAVAGGVHERAVYSITKAQAAVEAAAGGKVAAVAASAAAMAGGGYATVEHTVSHTHGHPLARTAHRVTPRSSRLPSATEHVLGRVRNTPSGGSGVSKAARVDEFGQSRLVATSKSTTEFGAPSPRRQRVRVISAAASGAVRHPVPPGTVKPKVAPEFNSPHSANEFGP